MNSRALIYRLNPQSWSMGKAACGLVKTSRRQLDEVVGARVSRFRPICLEDYGIIWTEHGLRVARVFSLQSKGGGKNGKHDAVTDSSIITAISYASVQIYEHYHGAQFRDIPRATALLQTKQFGHIPSITFLCLLIATPKILRTGGIELSSEDSQRFTKLVGGLDKFNAAMVLFRKRGKKKPGEISEEEDAGDQ
ncbi:hypothetical protein B0H17DRAFT_983291 [Mycena rosella]|uniref:Uncharacterized protein n=1 Tax=Mycena rosella TaxID=1033263 RepID=A0AAD7DFF3_MYCRO|nr:hypothetical protein B0H17DRAFT_983291 [Mycena rosella]